MLAASKADVPDMHANVKDYGTTEQEAASIHVSGARRRTVRLVNSDIYSSKTSTITSGMPRAV